MAVSDIFDVNKQFIFYGSYHTNRINLLIHIICVPLLIWSFQVLIAELPLPAAVPTVHYAIHKHLVFDLNASAIFTAAYLVYYLTLEPTAALIYAPQFIASLLTATAFSYRADHLKIAGLLHGVSWIAQFAGHGLAEKRAPALIDNLLGAVVLAPFFVHLELLFKLGYNPSLHKSVENGIAKEVLRLRRDDRIKREAQKDL